MVYLAKELLARLKYLTLAGNGEYGELEWIGTLEDWNKVYEESLD